MIEGMDAVLNSTGEIRIPIQVESQIADAWEEG
jgi:hypothetical protein